MPRTRQTRQDFTKAGDKLTRHIYYCVLSGSKIERAFVTERDTCDEVVAYAELPRGFLISTPVGDYNPSGRQRRVGWPQGHAVDVLQLRKRVQRRLVESRSELRTGRTVGGQMTWHHRPLGSKECKAHPVKAFHAVASPRVAPWGTVLVIIA
ncbi:hypothetical protein [Fulvimonas yonginensis]|uniref:Type III restriction enzyme C-terminal endonuclease domain-containing protein n=1 Tax=Fulvimonas yonginensis TaxID=1495200 RepID=A0ABU8J8P9_9GAMM